MRRCVNLHFLSFYQRDNVEPQLCMNLDFTGQFMYLKKFLNEYKYIYGDMSIQKE